MYCRPLLLLTSFAAVLGCNSPEVDPRGEEIERLAVVFATLDTENATARQSAIEALESLELSDPDARAAQDACGRYLQGIGEAEDAASAVRTRMESGEQEDDVNDALGRAVLILEDSELAAERCSRTLDTLNIRL